jgi:rhamnogalacturonan endolyase
MGMSLPARPRRLVPSAFIAVALATPLLHAADALPAVAKPTVNTPVTVTDNGETWTMDNGIVKVTIEKHGGVIPSLVYHGVEFMNDPKRGGRWEQYPSGQVTPSVTIDPAKNGGERGEVAVKGVDGKMDLEVRYTMERGVSGIYAYAEFSHGADYPEAGLGESRYLFQMKPLFDWLSVDADRNMLMHGNDTGVVIHAKEQTILNSGIYKGSVEHKYSYSGVLYKLPAFGWSSTQDHIGVYMINPTTEYIGGGATRLDLTCHLGATMITYWTSGHYGGGANCNVPAGLKWNKVIGPIFIYFNSLANPQTPSQNDLSTLAATAGNPTIPRAWTNNCTALFQDALEKAKEVRTAWPFDWVKGLDYLHKEERGNVTGQLVLNDPQAASPKLPHLTVGLAHAEYQGKDSEFVRRSGNGTSITWPHDGLYYQFWNDGNEDGTFTITNAYPGTYTLHAFADGVLGEFAKANITVEAGKTIDLGKLEWKPVRYGNQVWEIGYPDRTGCKFFKGDGANYWRWGWDFRYALLFPKDITYTIGKSDYHKDWFFEQVPHVENRDWLNPAARDPANQPFGWVRTLPTGSPDPWKAWGHGRATTWTIKFNMAKPAHGQATLRLALAGADGGGGLEVAVNGRSVGTIQTVGTNALRYNTAMGVWREYTQPFDASLLKWGENQMQLTVPAGDLTTGVVYDYLRLELDENQKPDSKPLSMSGM